MQGSDTQLPTGRKPTARDPEFRENPHPCFDALRAQCPVHWDHELKRFILSRASDISMVLADRTFSSDPLKAAPTAYGRQGFREVDRGRLPMVFIDDPDHRRLRGLVVKSFSARAVETLRPRVEGIAADLLDRIVPDEPFDLVASYANPLPTLVIGALLGVEQDRTDDFKRWSDDFAIFFDPNHPEEERRRLDASQQAFEDYLRHTVVKRRDRPQDDLLSELVAAEQDGERLSEAEILSTSRFLLVAGILTTTDLIGNSVVALLRHPAQLARLRANPELWPTAVEEMLRYDPPVTSVGRQVLEDRRIGNFAIEAGQTITAMLPAANHDPELHVDPHVFDIGRESHTHLSFGGGAHFCLGAALARMESAIALDALFSHFPHLCLVPNRSPIRKAISGLNGYSNVWLRAN